MKGDGGNRRRVEETLALTAGLPVRRLWLDCEAEPVPPDVVAQIQDAVDACGEFPVGIYTGYWWWPKTGNSRAFVHLPLWIAYYDAEPSLTNCPELVPGWRPVMKQFGGSQLVCGQSVDVNYYDANYHGEKTMTRDEAIRVIRQQQAAFKQVWTYVFLAKGWPLPPEIQ